MQAINLLRYTYIGLIIINLIVFLFRTKKMNFLFIYFLSSIIYYIFAISGKLYILDVNGSIWGYDIDIKTNIVLIINMVLIFIATLIPEKNIVIKKKSKKKHINLDLEKCSMSIFFIMCFILTIYTVITTNMFSSSGNFNKEKLMENTGTIVEYFKSIIMFSIVYIFIEKDIQYKLSTKILLMGSLFVTFLLGHRSYIVIAIIAIGFNYYNEKIAKNNKSLFRAIIKNYKIVLIAMLVIFVTFMIKGVTAALFDHNFDLVKTRLTNLDYYINTFKISEPNTTTMNLDTILRNNYMLDKSSYTILITLFIPFISRIVKFESFTYMYQETLFGTSNRASTFLGEAYANGGFLLVGVIITLLLLLLKFIDIKFKNSNNNILKTFMLISGVDLSFYIHRNSMDYAFVRIRSYIYIVILIYIIKLIISNLNILKGHKSK